MYVYRDGNLYQVVLHFLNMFPLETSRIRFERATHPPFSPKPPVSPLDHSLPIGAGITFLKVIPPKQYYNF